jgi:hypothetical protein
LKESTGSGIRGKNTLSSLTVGGFLSRRLALFNPEAASFSEPSDRSRKVKMLIFHQEPKDAPPNAASETLEDLPRRIDRERRSFLVMERASGLKHCARALQGEVRRDDINDVH